MGERPGQSRVRHAGHASGASFTWAGNSRQYRLTPFANDPVSDSTSEAILLRDDETGEVWGATPGPLARSPKPPGWSGIGPASRRSSGPRASFASTRGLRVSSRPGEGVDADADQHAPADRTLSVYSYNEWVLGPPRMGHQRHVVTSRDAATGALSREIRTTPGLPIEWRSRGPASPCDP